MKVISKTILLSVFSLVWPAISSASLTSGYISLVDTSQNQTFESEPPAPSFKLAAVHFISNDVGFDFGGQKENSGGQEFLPGDLCKTGGYSLEGCPASYIKGEECPYDSKYVKECIDPETWCKDNGYKVTSCAVPNYLANPCPYLSSLYKSCEVDNIRACKEAGYLLTCEAGKVGDSAQICFYNSSYKKCICNPCSGYGYTAAEASAQGYIPGEVCNSCGTMKYKRTENKCDGYKTCDCGSASGAKVCYSGTIQKFDSCKECCDAKYQYDSSNCSGSNKLAGGSCGGKYEKCQPPCSATPKIGDILYSDKSTCAAYLAEKTPIGVVVDTQKRIAIGLLESGTRWSYKNVDIPGIKNLTTVDAVKSDNNAKAITQAFIKYCENGACGQNESETYGIQAWSFTKSYVVEGTKKGDWYMPNAAIMIQVCDNLDKINAGFKILNDANYSAWGIDGTGYPSKYKYGAYSVKISDTYQLAAEKDSATVWKFRCQDSTGTRNSIQEVAKDGGVFNPSIRVFYSF